MFRFMVRSVILLSLLSLAASASGQVSFDFTGTGARAKAMGGAYLGISDDVTAGTWNPAGLWVQDGTMLGLELGTFMPRGESSDRINTIDQEGSWSKVSNFNLVTPIRIKGHPVVLSASYSNLFEDFFSTFTSRSTPYQTNVFNQTPLDSAELLEFTVNSEYYYAPYTVSLGFGTPISEKISAGFTTDIYIGSGTETLDQVVVFNNHPSPFDVNQRGTGVLRTQIRDTVTFSGLGVTGGLLYHTDRLGLGVRVHAPLDFKVEADRKVFQLWEFAGLPISGFSDTTFIDDQLIKYDLPIMAGFGISYRVTENLLIATDVEYRGFSGKKIQIRTERNLSEDTEVFTEVDPFWEDVIAVRAGAEYLWETGKPAFPIVPLRVGFARTPMATQNGFGAQSDSAAIVDQNALSGAAAATTISAGFGVQWSQIHLDLAYSFTTLDLESTFVGQDAEGGRISFPLQSNNRSHRLIVTFTGYF